MDSLLRTPSDPSGRKLLTMKSRHHHRPHHQHPPAHPPQEGIERARNAWGHDILSAHSSGDEEETQTNNDLQQQQQDALDRDEEEELSTVVSSSEPLPPQEEAEEEAEETERMAAERGRPTIIGKKRNGLIRSLVEMRRRQRTCRKNGYINLAT